MTAEQREVASDRGEPPVISRTRSGVAISGSDAIAFANGQLSQDITSMSHGTTRRSLILEPDGHFGDLVFVMRISEQRLVVTGAHDRAEEIKSRLARFKLRVDVTLELVDATETFGDIGGSADVAGGGALLKGESFERPRVFFEGDGGLGVPGRSSHGDQLSDELLRLGVVEPEDATWCSLPHEIGRHALDAAVSFTKGCYTGQELVARVDARSTRPPFRLCAFRSDETPPSKSPVLLAGEEVGTVCRVGMGGVPSGGAVGMVRIARRVTEDDLGHVSASGVALSCREL